MIWHRRIIGMSGKKKAEKISWDRAMVRRGNGGGGGEGVIRLDGRGNNGSGAPVMLISWGGRGRAWGGREHHALHQDKPCNLPPPPPPSPYLNPFLFIRGLPRPSCIQTSYSLNCLKLNIPGFPHNCLTVSSGDIRFKKNPRYSIGLEIRRQTALNICIGLSHPTGRPVLLSDNISGHFCQGWRNPLMIEIAVIFDE